VQEVKAYKVYDKIYETLEEAEKAQALQELKMIIDEFYYNGINEKGIEEALIDYKASLKEIFNRL